MTSPSRVFAKFCSKNPMRISVSVIVAPVIVGNIIESETRIYTLCSIAQHGGAADLFDAVMTERSGESRPSNLKPDRVILKCRKDSSDEQFKEEIRMLDLLSDSRVTPRYIESFILPGAGRKPCVAMEKVGVNLESLRLKLEGLWPSATLGSIGHQLIVAIRKLHTEYMVVHHDLHAGNICLADEPGRLSRKLLIIDLGDMTPLETDNRGSADFYRIDEVRQAVLTIRFLHDGNVDYYVTKRYVYDSNKICQGVQSPLCDALRYVFELPNEGATIDYDFLIEKMTQMTNRRYINGIRWGPFIKKYGMPDLDSLSGFRPLLDENQSSKTTESPCFFKTPAESITQLNQPLETRNNATPMSIDSTVSNTTKFVTTLCGLFSISLSLLILFVI